MKHSEWNTEKSCDVTTVLPRMTINGGG